MNTFQIKLIAVILMVIDHVGYFLFPDILILRIIGRLSFPLFAFLIVKGYGYTRNKWRYFFRLFIFANIIQTPSFFIEMPFNIFYTLSFGLLSIIVIHLKKPMIERIFFLVGIALVVDIIQPDYALYGVLLIIILHVLEDRWLLLIAVTSILAILFYGYDNIQIFAVFSLGIMYLYNKKEGPRWKIFFYSFYPVHMVFLEWLSQNL